MAPEGTLVLLDGVVNQHVSFELVLAVKLGVAGFTRVRLLPRVDQHVHLEVVLRLKPLLTLVTLVLPWKKSDSIIRGDVKIPNRTRFFSDKNKTFIRLCKT